jgi:acid stress chaperone HdeB
MKSPIAVFAAFIFGAGLSTARADSIDMEKMKCSELIEMTETDEAAVTYTIFWLDGYLSGVSGDAKLDEDGIATFTENILKSCKKSPSAGVLKMAKKVGLQ